MTYVTDGETGYYLSSIYHYVKSNAISEDKTQKDCIYNDRQKYAIWRKIYSDVSLQGML
ncbi:hypothetical protein NARC_40103 [Candidatus Nitrosocosmicus arcticus]|uniref:Uncharacterized protein n=1 Tax=Candidatus Nitrosocosmicus arcticus TaxID=2035267 RepID=A0A557SX09_9ARCH|nr:hypothetical protein NARC_40103 [Candidatus Nitrosocosmicus arcticus]